MKFRQNKNQAKLVTITAERLSDNSRITFTISSDKTIEHLRTLLNHHLPPYSPKKFYLYSYQRGALIHFHPPSFKLDYFPVIFDQKVLLLKMDDRHINDIIINSEEDLYKDITKRKFSLRNSLSSTTTTNTRRKLSTSSSSKVTCLSILKQIFQSSRTNSRNVDYETNILFY